MADWSLLNREWPPNRPYEAYEYTPYPYNHCYSKQQLLVQQVATKCFAQQAQPPCCTPSPPAPALLLSPPLQSSPPAQEVTFQNNHAVALKGDNPREIRNKAEKQRRDKLNHSISELASMVPPVVAASRKIDKTGVLRLTAHYLRSHQYVFGDTLNQTTQEINSKSALALLQFLNGFLLTTTYKGIVVVASQNIQQYLGYSELDLLGQNIFNITHEDDHQMLREQLMPSSHLLGPNGELLIPDEPDGSKKIADTLANEKRRFIVRFKKLSQRSEPPKYITCHVEGSLRKSDRACRGYNRCCQKVRRARVRGDNPCSSGNDVVFIGVVRPKIETFISESEMESFRMEYRTRHSIDGEIIQCEQRISLVTGYMTHEVNGVNAMNFMHRDDVRWVIIALREMYDQHRLYGESCYRLMTKNGQFIYMRTRGRLEVDHDSRAVTSFICTNTVVEEEEGKHLIKLMKKKFTLMVNNNEEPPQEEDTKEVCDNQTLPVEDPRQLEKVILHLVTNLPSPQPDEKARSISPDHGESPPLHLSIIPPRKERIVSAIEKIYSIIKSFKKEPDTNMQRRNDQGKKKPSSHKKYTIRKPSTNQTFSNPNSPFATTLGIRSTNSIAYDHCRSNPNEGSQQNPVPERYSLNIAENLNRFRSNLSPEINSITHTEISVSSACLTTGIISFNNVSSSSGHSVPVSSSSLKPIKSLPMLSGSQNESDKQSKYLSSPTGSQPGTSSGIGTKRPIMSNEQNTKKKMAKNRTNESINLEQPSELSDPLYSFLDDRILNSQFPQIEATINSLEQSIDPFFPDLLDVQDFLGALEEQSEKLQDQETN